MFRSRGRLISLVTGVLGLLVVATAAYLLLPPRQTSDVAVPRPGATPEQVVAAYLDALNAHDCDTAEALMVEDAEGSATSWCGDVASLANVEVQDHDSQPPEWSGRAPSEEVAHVPVTFDLMWRAFHSDGSMAEGTTQWGYLLVRASADSPWRIFDEGIA